MKIIHEEFFRAYDAFKRKEELEKKYGRKIIMNLIGTKPAVIFAKDKIKKSRILVYEFLVTDTPIKIEAETQNE